MPDAKEFRPRLSVVAASRNDGHGLHPLERTQRFVDGLADQASRFGRHVELVLVDWNPPPGAAPLSSVVRRPDVAELEMRTVTVPPSAHARLPASDKLQFFQMIAKNVGIRRATGDNILATNIDILLSDDLFLQSTKNLLERTVYRADRVDIPFDPSSDTNVADLRSAAPLRENRIDGTHYPQRGRAYPHIRGASDLMRFLVADPVGFFKRAVSWSENGGPPGYRRYRLAVLRVLVLPRLHLNACGDFTLMTRNAWHELRGYPEWGMFSWNLDSLLLYQAAAAGFEFVVLPSPALHLEHSSGWTPEAHRSLFDDLAARRIPVLTDADLAEVAYRIWRRRRHGEWRMNLDGWGMAGDDLEEATDSAA